MSASLKRRATRVGKRYQAIAFMRAATSSYKPRRDSSSPSQSTHRQWLWQQLNPIMSSSDVWSPRIFFFSEWEESLLRNSLSA
ncbi:unnamed protein product [Allacma fusca]|uniref:Uncharacterized protein n=1 Tax=Allacma fusca TaxID=39272 RepID=A0A8J2L017_9HEXA|nr:unnamed protein product [Allacma fusca]